MDINGSSNYPNYKYLGFDDLADVSYDYII